MSAHLGGWGLRLATVAAALSFACSGSGEGSIERAGSSAQALAVAVPSRIQAEAYARAFDSTPEVNYGAYVAECDRHDGVDIDGSSNPNGAGCSIGWTTAGEWLEYDIVAPAACTVDLTLHVASDLPGRQFHLSLDGVSLNEQNVLSDGDWSPVAVAYSHLALSAGPHTLRFSFDTDSLDFDYLDVTDATLASACSQTALPRLNAVASSQEGAAYPASFVIDGDPTTRWSSAFSDPQSIYVDLGENRRVNRAVLTWEVAASREYTLSVSDSSDGPWQVVASSSTGDGGVDDLSFAPVSARYVRLSSSARTTYFGISLYDFAVYGDVDPSCAAPTCVNRDASNTTPLTVTRTDIGARAVLGGIDGGVRIAREPLSGNLVYLTGDGSLFQVALAPGAASTSTLLADAAVVMAGTDLTPSSFQGMAFAPNGDLYVSVNIDGGVTNRGLVRRGIGAGPRSWSTFAITEPYPNSNTPFDHHFNGIVVSPDGNWVYLASGSRTDHGEVQDNGGAFPGAREVPLTSSMFRMPASGSNILLQNDAAALDAAGYRFASGLRNSFDPQFGPGGELFAGDNGPDADYSDELNVIRAGNRYGFPWRLGAENNEQQFGNYNPMQNADGTWSDPRLHAGFAAVDHGFYANDPTFPPAPANLIDPIISHGPDADEFRDLETGKVDHASAIGSPIRTFTAHRSPLGLSFDLDGALCGDFKNNAFILSWGAAEPVFTDQGQDLLLLTLTPVSTGQGYEVSARQLVTGMANPIDSVLVGNKLYVIENAGAGHIWEFSFPTTDAR